MLLNLLMLIAAVLTFTILSWTINSKNYFELCLRSFVLGGVIFLTSLLYGYDCHMFGAYYVMGIMLASFIVFTGTVLWIDHKFQLVNHLIHWQNHLFRDAYYSSKH